MLRIYKTHVNLCYKYNMRKENHIFGFIGLSASGKTSLAKHLTKRFGFIYVPSVTTRQPRKGNIKEHKHVSIEVFENHIKNNELLEHTKFIGHYYGRLKKDVNEALYKNHIVYTLSADRVKHLKKIHKNVKIILIEPEDPIFKTIEKRLSNRKITQKDLLKRLSNAKKELQIINDLKEAKLIDHIVQTLEKDKLHAHKEIENIARKHL